MTDNSNVAELMRHYTDDEPPLRLTVEDVRRAAGSASAVEFARLAPATKRRWIAPIAVAAAAAVVLGGVAVARVANPSATTVTPGGGSSEQPSAPSTPTPLPSGTPIPTGGATPTGPQVSADQMPDLLRSIASQAWGGDLTEKRLRAGVWTVVPTALEQGETVVPLSEAARASEWVGVWKDGSTSNNFSLYSRLVPTDLAPADLFDYDRSCLPSAQSPACVKRDLPGGWHLVEAWNDLTGIEVAESRRVTHSMVLWGNGREVSAVETRHPSQRPKDVKAGFTLTSDQLERIVLDPRLRFPAPDPLPATPSWDHCALHPDDQKCTEAMPKG